MRYTNTPKTSLKGINAELVKIEEAFLDVLDRQGDGTNYMDTDLDMNSHRILNLPAPIHSQEPVRLGDVKPFIDASQTAMDSAIEAAEEAQESAEDSASSAAEAADSASKAKEVPEINRALLIAQGLSGNYGFFEKGFTYNESGDVGIDADGNIWTYNGTFPFQVAAGTTPSEPDYKKVTFSEAQNVALSTGQSVQSFADSFALKIFQSPTNGGLIEIQTRTIDANEVYEVRKTSDDSLATIYRDAAGLNEITQNGTDNKSGSDGVVEFYIADGDYYVEVNGVKSYFITLLKADFETVEDAKNYSGIAALLGSRVYLKDRQAYFNIVETSTVTPTGISVIQSEANTAYSYELDYGSTPVTATNVGCVDDGNDYYDNIYEGMRLNNSFIVDIPVSVRRGIGQPVNSKVYFVGEGKITLLSSWFSAWGFEAGSSESMVLSNPVIDGANFAGTNGIGIGGSGANDGIVRNVHVQNPVIMNCKRQSDYLDEFSGGGRGVMIETRVDNIQVDNPKAINCTSAYAFQGSISDPANNVTVVNPMAESCMHYAEFYDLPDAAGDPNGGGMGGINLVGGYAHNVGLAESEFYSGDGAFSANDSTGAIISERGRHILWKGFKIHNDSSYGQIGSVFRGTGFHMDISGQFIGSCKRVMDVTTDDSLLPIGGGNPPPSGLSFNSRGISCDIKVIGDCDKLYRCNTPEGTTLGHLGHNVRFEFSSNPAVELIEVPSARSDAYLTAYNFNNGTLVTGSFNRLIADGNSMPSSGSTSYQLNNMLIGGLATFSGSVDVTGAMSIEGNLDIDANQIVRINNLPTDTGVSNRLAKGVSLPAGFSYVIIKD